MPYISEPIHYITNLPISYRLDSRSPEIILKEGFNGTNNLWFNSIFGEKTIFASTDLEGINYYLKELKDCMAKKINSRTFHLYRISSLGIPAVVLHNQNNLGFAKQLATRDPNVATKGNPDEYGMIEFYYLTRISNYLDQIASRNHEVQLCGPITKERVSYIRTISLL
tara:strand:- start:89 stop:592 length:504 start_codon:yes stop_codon:yes gene_type:complete